MQGRKTEIWKMCCRVGFSPVSEPKCGFTMPPCPGSAMELALFPPLSDPKIYKKTPLKKGTCLGAVLATRAAQKEYSGELGSQNGSKMESKMDVKVTQKGSLLKNTKY